MKIVNMANAIAKQAASLEAALKAEQKKVNIGNALPRAARIRETAEALAEKYPLAIARKPRAAKKTQRKRAA